MYFHVTVGYLNILPGKMFIHIICIFFSWVIHFLLLNGKYCFMYSRYSFLVRYIMWKYFLPFLVVFKILLMMSFEALIFEFL